MSKNGREILEDLLCLVDEEMFRDMFDVTEFYSRTESAFKNEGDNFNCNLCDFVIDGNDTENDDVFQDAIEEHIHEEHSDDLIIKALASYLAPRASGTIQAKLKEESQ